MNKIFTQLEIAYTRITGKIAFYPTLIAVLGFSFGFVMQYAEQQGVSKILLDKVPQLVISDADTARTLLSTFIAGIISLMVFSFSMVMILLNQAANNYSPRLLPNLIANKEHQLVLGTYLATILYCIMVLLSIAPDDNKFSLPGFSVVLSIALVVTCLALFVYFIHSISQSIQITYIVKSIFSTARKRLSYLINEKETYDQPEQGPLDTADWQEVNIDKTGYLQSIATESMQRIAEKQELQIEALIPIGTFILEGMPVLKVSKELDEEVKDNLLTCLNLSESEMVSENYVLAFKQLTEIALKAMSPGINDPGTAITCLDYLTELFALRLLKRDSNVITNEDQKVLIQLRTIRFDELIYHVYAALRQYCKHDVIMMKKLLLSLNYLCHSRRENEKYQQCLVKEARLALEDIRAEIKNSQDLKDLEAIASRIPGVNSKNPVGFQ
ncbi:DUF2254 domain-containing protein [Croceiramulus getboli]|nr:DUF2254 domain-containing protein [Flavobacteriaceae bacterium YJPT1-3]